MKNNYRFFQNRDCEFFPCHKTENEDSFNCLFCYCPLYLKENCLGSPDYILNGKGQKIRDCSNCTIVHRPEMYDAVIAQFQKQDCVVFVSIWDLKDEIMARIAEIASWEQMDPESRKEHKDEAEKTVMRFLSRYNNRNRYLVPVLLQPFSRDCIKSDGFMLGKKNISCRILERIDPSKITQGYLYAFHAPEIRIEEMDSLLGTYYLETFQIACMDIVRKWIRKYLERKHSVESVHYCSPSFGPGYYGMPLEAAGILCSLMDTEQVGISWHKERMEPMMSLAGIYLISEEPLIQNWNDCENCIGQPVGCEYCINKSGH